MAEIPVFVSFPYHEAIKKHEECYLNIRSCHLVFHLLAVQSAKRLNILYLFIIFLNLHIYN